MSRYCSFVALILVSISLAVVLVSNSVIVHSDGVQVIVYQEFFKFSGIASPDRIIIDELRLRVIDASTNQSVGRGFVTLYFALWYKPGKTWVVCEVDRKGVLPNGTVVFSGNYTCRSYITDPEVWNNMLKALARVPAKENFSYILLGYTDPQGYYVSEPEVEAYFVYNGFSNILYATFMPIELLPADEPLLMFLLLPMLIYFVYKLRLER